MQKQRWVLVAAALASFLVSIDALVASLGPLEIDAHRINDTRSVGNGPPVRFAASRCL